MKILVLGLNYAPEKVGIAVYTTGMAKLYAAIWPLISPGLTTEGKVRKTGCDSRLTCHVFCYLEWFKC